MLEMFLQDIFAVSINFLPPEKQAENYQPQHGPKMSFKNIKTDQPY